MTVLSSVLVRMGGLELGEGTVHIIQRTWMCLKRNDFDHLYIKKIAVESYGTNHAIKVHVESLSYRFWKLPLKKIYLFRQHRSIYQHRQPPPYTSVTAS